MAIDDAGTILIMMFCFCRACPERISRTPDRRVQTQIHKISKHTSRRWTVMISHWRVVETGDVSSIRARFTSVSVADCRVSFCCVRFDKHCPRKKKGGQIPASLFTESTAEVNQDTESTTEVNQDTESTTEVNQDTESTTEVNQDTESTTEVNQDTESTTDVNQDTESTTEVNQDTESTTEVNQDTESTTEVNQDTESTTEVNKTQKVRLKSTKIQKVRLKSTKTLKDATFMATYRHSR
ncbi:hypothetical protein BaRGS_00019198 [Batillaria attramentaria]|uniref:Uncharacterized protein n=1 Tax=Batillaria attramentaria TaxID=370345 RepID=A0ABD0KRM0_9CAEN